MNLSKAEQQLMELIWEHKRIFLKELIALHPEPRPASSTVATLLKRMQDKGYVAFKLYGNSREYYPLVGKTEYFGKQLKDMIANYFGNSPLNFASFFTTTSDISSTELESLKKIIDQEIKSRKDDNVSN